MNKRNIIITTLLFAGIITALLYTVQRLNQKNYTKKVELSGESVEISTYHIPDNIRLNLIYEPRNDLDDYPWIKPLLFSCANGFYLQIPTDEWTLYYEGPSLNRKDIEEYHANLIKTLSDNAYSGLYNEISRITECKVAGERYLAFCLKEKNADRENTGNSLYKMLKHIDGRWKVVVEPDDVAAKRVQQIADSYDTASRFIAEELIKSRPAEKLK